MISPCECKGSMKNVHFSCLQRWLATKVAEVLTRGQVLDVDGIMRCDICKTQVVERHCPPTVQQHGSVDNL
jgi:E3 ubiquitin-protein ligase DOA10